MRQSQAASRLIELREEPVPAIRVLVVDDHDLFRVGLATMLGRREEVEVVGQASNGRMAVRLAAELRPQVVLLDRRLPDVDCPGVIRQILTDCSSIRVLVLTVSADQRDVAAAISAGASGYLLKDVAIDDVVAAIQASAGGDAWLSPRAARALLDEMRSGGAGNSLEEDLNADLSSRELDVLRLVSRGLDNKQIAAALYISPRTAKNHVSSVLAKLGVTNRVQAAVYAVLHGIT